MAGRVKVAVTVSVARNSATLGVLFFIEICITVQFNTVVNKLSKHFVRF